MDAIAARPKQIQHATQKTPHKFPEPSENSGTSSALDQPDRLEEYLDIPPGRLEAHSIKDTLSQAFEVVLMDNIQINMVGEPQTLPKAHMVLVNQDSCLDPVRLHIAVYNKLDWVAPIAEPSQEGSPKPDNRLAKCITSLPTLNAGSKLITERKAHDNHEGPTSDDNPNNIRKQQLCVFQPAPKSATAPQNTGDNTLAIALWDKSSSPASPTKLSQVTMDYPNGQLGAIAARTVLSLITGQSFHNVINILVESPESYEEIERRVKVRDATNQYAHSSQDSDALNSINKEPFPKNIPRQQITAQGQAIAKPKLCAIPEDTALNTENMTENLWPANPINLPGPTQRKTYERVAKYLDTNNETNLAHLKSQRSLNPKNTANYAKAFCRLLLMGATTGMMDWMLQNKLSPMLPTNILEHGVSRAITAMMGLAMIRYTFSGTAPAKA